MRKGKRFKKWISLLLVVAMTFGFLPGETVTRVKAANVGSGEAGARTYASGDDLFLGGNYIELGLRSTGVFGTEASAPTSGYVIFHPRRATYSSGEKIGLRSNGDKVWSEGLADGDDETVDFFLPGTIDEGWLMGWSTEEGTAASYQGRSQASGGLSDYNVTVNADIMDESDDSTLKASTKVTVSSAVTMDQTVSFGVDDKFFQTTITLKNTSSGTLYDVSYIRAFDPDQKSGLIDSDTDNYFYKDASGNVWVMAFGNNSLSVGSSPTDVNYDTMITNNDGLQTPFIFCAPAPAEDSGYSVQAVNTGVGWSNYGSFYRGGSSSYLAGEQLYGKHYPRLFTASLESG